MYTAPSGVTVPLKVILPRRLPEHVDGGVVQIDALAADFAAAGAQPAPGGVFAISGIGSFTVQGQPKRGDPALSKWLILTVQT